MRLGRLLVGAGASSLSQGVPPNAGPSRSTGCRFGRRDASQWAVGQESCNGDSTVRFSDPEVESLIVGLSDEYDTRYGANIEMSRASEAEFEPPAGLFVVLMDGPTTAAGGGFRRFNKSTL